MLAEIFKNFFISIPLFIPIFYYEIILAKYFNIKSLTACSDKKCGITAKSHKHTKSRRVPH